MHSPLLSLFLYIVHNYLKPCCVDSESDDESEVSDKSGSSRSKRKHNNDSSSPPSDKRSSIASTESSTKVGMNYEELINMCVCGPHLEASS